MSAIICCCSVLAYQSGNDSPTPDFLWGDMHVSITAGKPAFAASLWNPDPETSPQNFKKLLAT